MEHKCSKIKAKLKCININTPRYNIWNSPSPGLQRMCMAPISQLFHPQCTQLVLQAVVVSAQHQLLSLLLIHSPGSGICNILQLHLQECLLLDPHRAISQLLSRTAFCIQNQEHVAYSCLNKFIFQTKMEHWPLLNHSFYGLIMKKYFQEDLISQMIYEYLFHSLDAFFH